MVVGRVAGHIDVIDGASGQFLLGQCSFFQLFTVPPSH